MIEAPLRVELDVETRNRKRLKKPVSFGATWEIGFGPNSKFRVFCEVERGRREVYVLAIGVKQGNRLRIGREEIEL